MATTNAPIEWAGDRVSFRPTTPADTGEVLEVLDEAAGWLGGRGIRQWPDRFPPTWVAAAIERGETWLVDVGDKTAGTVTLDWADELWADVGGTAGYVHRLAVRRSARGLGGVILAWAEDRARERGAAALRLDCVSHNRSLRDYYEHRGFTHRGDARWLGLPGQRREDVPVLWMSRYERALADPRT
ncbi:GNAT family N-acetyltransferase [Kitasatospora sp. NPDC059146]|uniref:GNAT family N-acetyltransferase n=1 Tax=Kitasatospora sp. NPDC059146 TaxID=3346741 RepID=UPI0036B7E8A3